MESFDERVELLCEREELLCERVENAAATGAAMTKAERTRKALYDGAKDSLRTKMKAIKKATRAQYGASSPQFAEVKSIRV